MKAVRLFLLIVSISFVTNLSSQTVYTTKTGKKYHKSNCRYLKYSKKEIKLDKAKELGYQACKVCKPTVSNTKKKTKQLLQKNNTISMLNALRKQKLVNIVSEKPRVLMEDVISSREINYDVLL